MKAVLRKFTLFVFVGVTCTAIQYAILIALVSLRDWQVTLASTLGFIVSALVNYTLNYFVTFKATRSHFVTLPRFAFMAGTGLALNAGILQVGLTYSALPYLWIQVAATIIVLFWNFIGSLKWSFAP